ncbi:uncharacterized protein [Diadema setosum]|uniref:uncharacterized protein n=1 Tax=Diadema setosum TaxID=31175 RepID=UPI003B3A9111
MNERSIELIINSTPIPEYQKELLTKNKQFTLHQALQLGRTYEASQAHIQALQSLEAEASSTLTAANIASMGLKHKQVQRETVPATMCKNCGGSHIKDKQHCPAAHITCYSCGKVGYYAKMCLSSKRPANKTKFRGNSKRNSSRGGANNVRRDDRRDDRRGQAVHNMSEHDEFASAQDSRQLDDKTFDVINKPKTNSNASKRDEVITSLNVRLHNRPGVCCTLNGKVDTGAQANTLPVRTFSRMFPEKMTATGTPDLRCLTTCTSSLTAYNGTPIKQYGTTIPCQHANGPWVETTFYVVESDGPVIFGLHTSLHFGLITLHCPVSIDTPVADVNSLKTAYPEQFDRVGEFEGEQHLVVDPNIPSHKDAPRKMPIALADKVKRELDRIVEQSVIRKITEPTEWVNSLTYVTKKDGSIRICLDPRHLNKSLIRPNYPHATLEELNHKFHGAKTFSKLDAKSGYWSVKLDSESQKLTTFQTPFGRYAFMRLPFGLNVSQDIFQLEMDRVREGCPGTVCIADDIVVYGATEAEHDRNLLHLMNAAKKHGLTFNSSKCNIKQNRVTFFGNVYTKDGIKPDPKKVSDLQSLPAPTCKTELQQFLGMMTYLSPFIKDFSTKSAELRDLLKKNADFLWEVHHQQAFESLKDEVSTTSVLQYYDTQAPVYLQCDASMCGLGAALLQRDDQQHLRPIAFASKTLSPTEQRYSCIERELLAIVFGVERFHTYLYGRGFHIITDHKPLIQVTQKPLTVAPARLQRMLIHLQGYNFDVTYQRGQDNTMAASPATPAGAETVVRSACQASGTPAAVQWSTSEGTASSKQMLGASNSAFQSRGTTLIRPPESQRKILQT